MRRRAELEGVERGLQQQLQALAEIVGRVRGRLDPPDEERLAA